MFFSVPSSTDTFVPNNCTIKGTPNLELWMKKKMKRCKGIIIVDMFVAECKHFGVE